MPASDAASAITAAGHYAPNDEHRAAKREAAEQKALVAGLEAAVVTTAVVGVGHGLAQSRIPSYRKFGASPKTFFLSAIVVAAFWVASEQAHLLQVRADADEAAAELAEADRAKRRQLIAANAAGAAQRETRAAAASGGGTESAGSVHQQQGGAGRMNGDGKLQ